MLSTFQNNGSKKKEITNSKRSFLASTNRGDVGKKRILLLVDLYDWCFFNIATRVKNQLGSKYIFEILTTSDFHKNIFEIIKNPYHIYLFFFPSGAFIKRGKLDYIKNVGKYKFKQKSKVMFCLYDNYIWRPDIIVDPRQKEIQKLWMQNVGDWLQGCDAYLWGSPKIRDNIYKFYKTIRPNASCMDGVDSNMFFFKEYNKDILTRDKLRIGWIGNSDITVSGLQKGYIEIKKYVTDLSNNFDFVPLDRQIKLIPHNEVPEYIHNIDIIVCYSTCEGTPNQILEGSSCGRCWVSTDVGVVTAVYNTIDDNPTGIIIKKNEESFKSALMKLYNNRQLIIQYGKNGRKAIEKKWDWNHRLEGFDRIFDQY